VPLAHKRAWEVDLTQKRFGAQESVHEVGSVTYLVTPVFADAGREDLAAKMKRLILTGESRGHE